MEKRATIASTTHPELSRISLTRELVRLDSKAFPRIDEVLHMSDPKGTEIELFCHKSSAYLTTTDPPAIHGLRQTPHAHVHNHISFMSREVYFYFNKLPVVFQDGQRAFELRGGIFISETSKRRSW